MVEKNKPICKHLGWLVNQGIWWCNKAEHELHCKDCKHYEPMEEMELYYNKSEE